MTRVTAEAQHRQNQKTLQWRRQCSEQQGPTHRSIMYPTPLSSTTVVGSRSSSSTRAIVSPVSSGRPSVTITLNCLPCSTARQGRQAGGQGA